MKAYILKETTETLPWKAGKSSPIQKKSVLVVTYVVAEEPVDVYNAPTPKMKEQVLRILSTDSSNRDTLLAARCKDQGFSGLSVANWPTVTDRNSLKEDVVKVGSSHMGDGQCCDGAPKDEAHQAYSIHRFGVPVAKFVASGKTKAAFATDKSNKLTAAKKVVSDKVSEQSKIDAIVGE
jgi:hypothetical protein